MGHAPGYAGYREAGAREDLASGLVDQAVRQEIAGAGGKEVADGAKKDLFKHGGELSIARRGGCGGCNIEGGGDVRGLSDDGYVGLTYFVIRGDDGDDGLADVCDARGGLDNGSRDRGADVALQDFGQGAQSGARELAGSGTAVVSGGGGAGDIGEGFSAYEEGAALGRRKGAACWLKEGYGAKRDKWEGAFEAGKIGERLLIESLFHDPIMTDSKRALLRL